MLRRSATGYGLVIMIARQRAASALSCLLSKARAIRCVVWMWCACGMAWSWSTGLQQGCL